MAGPFDPGSVLLFIFTALAFAVPLFIVYPPVPVKKSDALRQTHRRLGKPPKDYGARDLVARARAEPGRKARIESLVVYPIKSCSPVELERSKVLPQGLQYDRLYMFAQQVSPFPVAVDASTEEKSRHTWKFATQRQFPRMANLHVDLWVPDEKVAAAGGGPGGAYIVVRFPWRDLGFWGALAVVAAKLSGGPWAEPEKEIVLPVDFPSADDIAEAGYEFAEVEIWKDTMTALNFEKDLPRELRLYLGVSNKLGLFRVDPARLREVYRNAPPKEAAGYQPVTGFQDAVSSCPSGPPPPCCASPEPGVTNVQRAC